LFFNQYLFLIFFTFTYVINCINNTIINYIKLSIFFIKNFDKQIFFPMTQYSKSRFKPNSSIHLFHQHWVPSMKFLLTCPHKHIIFHLEWKILIFNPNFSTRLLLLRKSDYFDSSVKVLEAETIDLLEAIQVAISNSMHIVLFEKNCKTLYDVISSTKVAPNEFRDFVFQCRSLLLNRLNFVVSHVVNYKWNELVLKLKNDIWIKILFLCFFIIININR